MTRSLEADPTMPGPLSAFFAADHRRLDALLRKATAEPGRIALGPFGEFRAGLLKHIGMEEKVLFQVARRKGADPSLFSRLRVDHGAIASLLVPTPTPDIVGQILSVLTPHNQREEEPRGAYGLCDEAVGPGEAERLLATLITFPDVKLKDYRNGPEVFRHIEVNLDLSRRQWL